MTAEVAIMNRQGVALAADSAVTVNHPGGQKIYNTVNKLFTLSKHAPVGVMVYGVAELTGVPWETIIKSYRRQLGDTRLPRLEDYANGLVAFVKDHPLMFTPELQEGQVLSSVLLQFRSILAAFERRLADELDAKGQVSDTRIRRLVTDTIKSSHNEWTKAPRLDGTTRGHSQRVRRTWTKQIHAVMDFVFEKLPLSVTSRERLLEIAGLVFSKSLFPDNVSGIVVAGFGEEEFFPSLTAYDVEGVILNVVKLRKRSDQSHVMVRNNQSAVIPFAQREMVNLFMEGIDPRLRSAIASALHSLVEQVPTAIAEDLGLSKAVRTKVEQRATDMAQSFVDEFLEAMNDHVFTAHVDPIMSAVEHLPKEELASMAEALVSLTSFKRRVTRDPETVGGPIDVAVISKGDGFVWIKRKHYFDPALNHQFLGNYFND